MSESKKRNTHLPEFKAKVGLEAVRGVKTVNQLGQEYGVHPIQVGQCKREIQAQAKTLFEGKRGPQPIAGHSAPDRLYGEIGRLKMELDWLKKKVRDQPAMTRRNWIGAHTVSDAKAPVRARWCGPRHGVCAAPAQGTG
jgi:transposase-like protein